MPDPQETIDQAIQTNGYAAVAADDGYYYTVGMGAQGKMDLFALAMFPFAFFQCVAQDYANGSLKPNEPGLVEAFRIPGYGMEPAVVRLDPLTIRASSLIAAKLAPSLMETKFIGTLFVLGPDEDNNLANRPDSKLQFDTETAVAALVSRLQADIT